MQIIINFKFIIYVIDLCNQRQNLLFNYLNCDLNLIFILITT